MQFAEIDRVAPILTLDTLCASMAASGRPLSPRAARDWWTKGYIPRPVRRGLGRGSGTATCWIETRVVEQAQAVYDLIAMRGRSETIILGLWLWGFRVDTRTVRRIYSGLIARMPPPNADDFVAKLAARLARQEFDSDNVPVSIKNDLTDLLAPFLEIYFGIGDDFASEGLAELLERIQPFVEREKSLIASLAELRPTDDDFDNWARQLKEMASPEAQRAVITSATDYELMRARRLLLFVFGYLRRITHVADCPQELEDSGRRIIIVLGQLAVPIIVAVFRRDTLRQKFVSSLLSLATLIPRPRELERRYSEITRERAYH